MNYKFGTTKKNHMNVKMQRRIPREGIVRTTVLNSYSHVRAHHKIETNIYPITT